MKACDKNDLAFNLNGHFNKDSVYLFKIYIFICFHKIPLFNFKIFFFHFQIHLAEYLHMVQIWINFIDKFQEQTFVVKFIKNSFCSSHFFKKYELKVFTSLFISLKSLLLLKCKIRLLIINKMMPNPFYQVIS